MSVRSHWSLKNCLQTCSKMYKANVLRTEAQLLLSYRFCSEHESVFRSIMHAQWRKLKKGGRQSSCFRDVIWICLFDRFGALEEQWWNVKRSAICPFAFIDYVRRSIVKKKKNVRVSTSQVWPVIQALGRGEYDVDTTMISGEHGVNDWRCKT